MRQAPTTPTPADSLDEKVGRVIKAELTARGSTVPRLADAMNAAGMELSYRQLHRQLNGDARMTIRDLEMICAALDIEPDIVVRRAKDLPPRELRPAA
jgi:transcriptional regulator with XRE-family HTH domain